MVFLDTGYHFPETIGTRDAVDAVMDVNVITLTPRQTRRRAGRRVRPEAARPRPRPVLRAAQGQAAGGGPDRRTTPGRPGLRRDESPTRANTPVVGWDEKRQKVKVSPIARWTQDDVDAYVAEHGVLTNPLLMDGYASVGCAPCTRRVLEGEDARAGRWAGLRQDRVRAARLT